MVFVREQPNDNVRKWILFAGRKYRLAKCQSHEDNRAAGMEHVRGIFYGDER